MVRYKVVYNSALPFSNPDGSISLVVAGTKPIEIRMYRDGDFSRIEAVTVRRDNPETLQLVAALKMKSVRGWDEISHSNKERIEGVQSELRDAAYRVGTLARWRNGQGGEMTHRAIQSFVGWYVAEDAGEWISLPLRLSGKTRIGASVYLDHRFQRSLQTLLDEPQTKEPLGHDMLVEAEQILRSNPRGGLVFVVASLEAGIKEFITRVHPETEWLIENLPSPSLRTILTDYLPKLLVAKGVPIQESHIPRSMIDNFEKAVSLRNKLAHGRSAQVDTDLLQAIYQDANDLLWILDYASGYEWAVSFVRDEVRASWLPSTLD